MARIFLCYRSSDNDLTSLYFDEKLSEVFGKDNIFRARRSIEPGDSYEEMIEHALKECEVMLVIIGSRWLESLEVRAEGSTAEQQDWVRTEIATALGNPAVKVIPVLLNRVPRLDPALLPPDITALASKQYLSFDDVNAAWCLDRLVATLKRVLDRPDQLVS